MSGLLPSFSETKQQKQSEFSQPPLPPQAQRFILYPVCPPPQPSQFPVSMANLQQQQILSPSFSFAGQPQTQFGQNMIVLPTVSNNFVSCPQNYQNLGYQQNQMSIGGTPQPSSSHCGGNQIPMLPQFVGGSNDGRCHFPGQVYGQVSSQGNSCYTYLEMAQFYPPPASNYYGQCSSPSQFQPSTNINCPPPTSLQSLIVPQAGSGMQFIRAFTAQQQEPSDHPLLNLLESGNDSMKNPSLPSETKKSLCGFCRSNRASIESYTSHDLKNEAGVVTCPILRKYQCPLCKKSGDEAHTLKYCPESQNKQRNSTRFEQRKVKNSTGKSYILKY